MRQKSLISDFFSALKRNEKQKETTRNLGLLKVTYWDQWEKSAFLKISGSSNSNEKDPSFYDSWSCRINGF
jgi:hypothetical protein